MRDSVQIRPGGIAPHQFGEGRLDPGEALCLLEEAGRVGAWERDLRTGKISCSPMLERMFGYQPGAFPGTYEAFQGNLHPEDRERVLAEIDRVLQDRIDYRTEYRVICPDNQVVWLEARGRLFMDPDGQPERLAGVCMDITDRKHAEQSLRESEGRLRAVVETVVDGIITIDPRGTVTTFNPAAERIFGYPAAEVIGRNVNMLMPEPYRGQHDSYLRNYVHTGQAKIIGIGREVEGIRKNGERFPLYLGVSETRVDNRRIFTGIVRDISDRKAAEQALARQARELQSKARELARSNAELESFASIVSHDLRSPLVTVAGCAHMLEDQARDKLGPESLELIKFIHDSVDHMSMLIQSLLGYAKVGSGGLKVGPCDCREVLQKVLNGLKGALEANDAEVTHDLDLTVDADEALLAQLLQNLIENAIKYHGRQPPRVHVSARADAAEWVFSVRDNGIGIDPRDFPRLFEAFHRLHKDESQYKGVGIGLATCKKIVERHGGRIWVESEPGHGTTFYFAIPR